MPVRGRVAAKPKFPAVPVVALSVTVLRPLMKRPATAGGPDYELPEPKVSDAAALGGLVALMALSQLYQLPARLGDVHIDLVELLHHSKGVGLIGIDQSSLSHLRLADAPGNRRHYSGVVEIDSRRSNFGSGHGNICPRLGKARFRIVILLLADATDFDQLFVASCFGLERYHVGLGFAEARFCTVTGCLVGCGVDLVELLTLLNKASFHEEALRNNAAHLRPNLGHTYSRSPPRQLFCQYEELGFHGHDSDLRFHAGILTLL
jgi:hypothetical protein